MAAIGGVPNGKMSFDRPLSYRFNCAFDIRQAILARWLDRRGVKADFCTCVDLHQEADLLSRYQLLMVAGEYSHWTMAQRAQFDAFVAAGGNAALLGARSCQWPSRLEPSAGTGTANRVLVCYRSASADPDQRPEYKTVPWNTLGTSVHSAQSVGLSSEGPVYGGTGARPAIAYWVNAPHWIFEGTGLKPGDTFGEGIAGPKLDTLYPTVMLDGAGVEVSKNCSVVPGRFLPQRNAAWPVPEMATIVASVSAAGWGRWSLSLPSQPRYDNSYAFMAVFSRAGAAGTVFNAGTLDWVAGLQPEVQGGPATAVGKITANLITRLSGAAHRESAEIRRYFLYDIPQSDRYELAIGDTRTLARIRDSNGNIGDDSYRLEQLRGYLCRGYLSQVAGTVPVYRFFVEDFDRQVYRRYRYSLSPAVSPGWTPDGIAFYAYASPVPGSEPVYSWYSIGSARFASDATGWRFFYTRSPTNPSAGLCESDNTPWVFGNVAFHAPKV